MKRLLLAVGLLSLAGTAGAARRVPLSGDLDLGKAEMALKSNGFKVVGSGQENQKAYVILADSETKDPAPILEALLDADTKTMRRLARKWRDDTITAAEKDQLLKMLVLKLTEQ